MSGNNEVDQNLLEFARQVAAIPRRISEQDGTPDAASDGPVAVAPITADPGPVKEPPKASGAGQGAPSLELPGKPDKKLRTPDELASLISTALREVGDCPDQGFVVTVYGSNPWNAMLMIRPEAGPRIDRALWLSRVQDITARLRSEFDIADERSLSSASK
jgi:hypothetical protein